MVTRKNSKTVKTVKPVRKTKRAAKAGGTIKQTKAVKKTKTAAKPARDDYRSAEFQESYRASKLRFVVAGATIIIIGALMVLAAILIATSIDRGIKRDDIVVIKTDGAAEEAEGNINSN